MNSPQGGSFGNEQGHSQYPVGGFERQYPMYQPLGQPFNPHMQNYFPQPPWQPQYSPSMGRINPGENLSSKLMLPKLELKSFDGNMMNWMEFWDSFERNIHLNSSLCDVDKMSYLKASLKVHISPKFFISFSDRTHQEMLFYQKKFSKIIFQTRFIMHFVELGLWTLPGTYGLGTSDDYSG